MAVRQWHRQERMGYGVVSLDASSRDTSIGTLPHQNPANETRAKAQDRERHSGNGILWNNQKTSRKAKLSQKYLTPAASNATTPMEIATGKQLTPVPRETSSMKQNMLSSKRGKTYYHRSENQIHNGPNSYHGSDSVEIIGKRHRIQLPVLGNKIPTDVVSAVDQNVSTNHKPTLVEDPKKTSMARESSHIFFQPKTINLNNQFSKVATQKECNDNNALTCNLAMNYCSSTSSTSNFHPNSRNQFTVTLRCLPLREVYLMASVTDERESPQVVERDRESRIRKWLNTLN